MDDYVTQEEYLEVEDLVKCAISARTKESAKQYINKLCAKKVQYCGYTATVYSSLCSSVSAASGMIADKENKLYHCNQDLEKFKDRILR